MGYSVSLTSASSQAEGSPGGTAASFVFNISRLAGDAGMTSFAGGLTDTLTITATADNVVEPNETFNVWIYRNSDPGNPFYQGQITLTNDDVGNPVFTTPAAVNVAENQTAVTTVAATGGSTPVFTLTGGADVGMFSITGAGVLTFNAGHDFEAPNDAVLCIKRTKTDTPVTRYDGDNPENGDAKWTDPLPSPGCSPSATRSPARSPTVRGSWRRLSRRESTWTP